MSATLAELFLKNKENTKVSEVDPLKKRDIDSKTFIDDISRVQNALIEYDVKQKDFVCIISNTRYEWLVVDVACVLTGVITVPVYPTLKWQDTGYILSLIKPKLLFVENIEQYEKIKSFGIPVVSFDPIEGVPELMGHFSVSTDLRIYPSKPEDIVTIVFTSGTEGQPKGVPQTHKNHVTNLEQVSKVGLFTESDSMFLFLPLSHSFGRLCGYVGTMLGVSMGVPKPHSNVSSQLDLIRIIRSIPLASPTIVPAVPKFFDQIKKEIQRRFSRVLKFLRKDTWIERVVLRMLGKISIPRIFGKRIKYCISGGAKLNVETISFFDKLGLCILEGYGLTETVVATHVNLPTARKVGSVGRPLPGISQKILDSEILLKGDNVFGGYWNSPSNPFTEDGWFKTGDIGHIDEEGFLFIEGRKKEILVLSNGKNVPALKLEAMLVESINCKGACVFGDGHDFVVAVLFDDTKDKTSAYYQQKLLKVNEQLNPFEKLKGLLVVNVEPSVANGMLTPTLKIKRKTVWDRFSEHLEHLFSKPGQIIIHEVSDSNV
ncbi:MAG: AMP-binding protein [Deltaproteobacteria bacterium]|nr:AMP-binding protein [Deltaproteobacteria bacterium]MCX7952622.1 AMP-binding protein [Deltaproteobacteria bacterium]